MEEEAQSIGFLLRNVAWRRSNSCYTAVYSIYRCTTIEIRFVLVELTFGATNSHGDAQVSDAAQD